MVILFGCGKKSESNPEAEKVAVKVAETWLAIIDEGKYGESWEEAAQLFKNAITKEKWEKTIKGTRPSFGNLISREVISATYKTSVPGAPDGEYVIIQFKTKFENKANAIETITPMKNEDGVWRVSGYYIK
ncbi:DUF4019 domain-containing protein [Planctomycetota bacterium]